MSKRLAELERKYGLRHAEMAAIVEKDNDEPLSDEDQEKFGAIKAELQAMKQMMALIKEVEALKADEAEPVESEDEEKSFDYTRRAAPAIRVKAAPAAPGIRAARFAIASAIAKQNGSVNAGVRFAQDMMGDALVAKALNSTTQVDGGANIPAEFVAELVDLLRAKSVVRAAGARVLPMPVGNLTLPRLQAAASAQWQDELTEIAGSQQAFDNIQFSAKKLTSLVAVTNDLMRRSPISVEAIVRDDMVKQIGIAEDKAFLFGTGTANQPAGIESLTAAANKFTNATTVPTLAIVNDVLFSLELLLQGKNVDTSSAAFIFHPSVRSYLSTLTDSTGRYFFRDELEAGRLIGYPVFTTSHIPNNLGTGPNFQSKIVLAAMDDMIVADTLSLRVDSSDVASYTQAGTTRSAFGFDQTVFRCITEVDFNVKHDVSAAVATVTNWRPSGWTANAGSDYHVQAPNTAGSAAKSARP